MISRYRLVAVTLLFFIAATTIIFRRSYVKPIEREQPPVIAPPSAVDLEIHTEKDAYPLSGEFAGSCTKSPEWLKELAGSPDFRTPFNFARRDIIIEEDPELDRSSITKLKDRLLPAFQEVKQLEEPTLGKNRCLPPLNLRVPKFPREVDASHILIGAATTVSRLEATISYFQRWLANTGARLVVDINGDDGQEPDLKAMRDLEGRMRSLGMEVTLFATPVSTDNNVQRYFRLVQALHKYKNKATKWVSFIDDDTFFVSLPALLSRLAEYDHQKFWYIGQLSEDWWTVGAYGYIAMGGGGLFLSVPLLDVLHENWDDCRKRTNRGFGDHQVAQCIEFHTDVHLTTLDGLYQIDVHGDRSGIFESGRPILTTHHWKEGYWSEDGTGADAIRHPRWFPLDKMSLISDLCGVNCVFQRYQLGKDTILTNGYSISVYPNGHLKNMEFFKMEKTWPTFQIIEKSLNTGWDHYLGPLRPALEFEKDKIQYRFMDAKYTRNGGVRQYFRHLSKKEGELDSIVELHWIRKEAVDLSIS